MIRKLLRRVGRRAGPKPCILMYHRVAQLACDPWGLAVAPERFKSQIEFLYDQRIILPLPTFVSQLRGGRLPPEAVAITFDDGYADNITTAEPILRDVGVSATLFVTTGSVGKRHAFWWDELAGMILDRREPLDTSVHMFGAEYRISVREWSSEDEDTLLWRAWTDPQTNRQMIYVDLWKRLSNLGPAVRDNAMEALRNCIGGDHNQVNADAATEDDLTAAAKRGTFQFGGHTVHHPRLPELDSAGKLKEVADGKRALEAIIGRPVEGFAYPFGALDEHSKTVVADCGFAWAVSTEASMIDTRRYDLFSLPRVGVPDEEIDVLGRLLKRA